MKIVAISRVLDEIDIVEAFVRHTASFVDHHIFMDNGSEDGTLRILSSLRDEGLQITVFQNTCVSFNEANHLTFLFREAIKDHAPDWVICIDTDEFIDDSRTTDGLRGRLGSVYADPSVLGVRLPMVFYAATRDDDATEAIVPLRMKRRREITNNTKVIARGNPAFEIRDGGHAINQGSAAGYVVYQTELRLAHYAERSPYQYVLKFVRGWNKVLAASVEVRRSGLSNHYKAPYELLLAQPEVFLKDDALKFKNEARGLAFDPIAYRGGPLRYTPPIDDAMVAVQGVLRSMRDLATRHGALLDAVPEAREAVAVWDSRCEKLF